MFSERYYFLGILLYLNNVSFRFFSFYMEKEESAIFPNTEHILLQIGSTSQIQTWFSGRYFLF